MSDSQDIKKIREKLYEEVWSEPMVTVAVRYELSDNGLRKRCKTLNIPLPPVGYWAKIKAGKPGVDKPALPPYKQTVLNSMNNEGESNKIKMPLKNKTDTLELIDLDELSVEQITDLHDFDLLAPGSLEILMNWCDEIRVPGRLGQCDNLISKHMTEIKYRKERDDEHPFTSEGIRLRKFLERTKYRENESVIPISVSDKQLNRAYRIIDTILKVFSQLKGHFSVERGKVDNITITLLGTAISFEMNECKTKLRHLIDLKDVHDLRPLYEETFDGRLRLDWKLYENKNSYNSDKNTSTQLSYVDEESNPMEKQIPAMILGIYKFCCNCEISRELERKKWIQQREWEKKKEAQKEKAEERRKYQEEKRKQEEHFVKSIPNHANDWFQHEQLNKYADELETYLISHSEDEYAVELLREYIVLIRENADNCNPLNHIITEMRKIKSKNEYQD